MSKWIAVTIAYNEEKLLPDCLRSLQGKVDRIIVVDGRIREMPGKSPISTDKTAQVALDYGAELIQGTDSWATEQDMRNQYLLGENGDWYLMIDSDERLLTSLPVIDDFPKDARCYRIALRMYGTAGVIIYPQRLYKHQGEMEYRLLHDALFSDGVLVTNPYNSPTLSSVVLLNAQPLRTEARWKLKRVKRKRCHDRETPLRSWLYGKNAGIYRDKW